VRDVTTGVLETYTNDLYNDSVLIPTQFVP
jgi:hypothetical protein